MSTIPVPSRFSRRAKLAVLLLVALGSFALMLPGTASAGEWAQVSCSDASGPVSTEGWSTGYLGGPTPSSGTWNSCDKAGGALKTADVSSGESQPSGMGSYWVYLAPAGSTIAGGSISASFQAPRGTVYMASPENRPLSADLLMSCTDSLCGYTGGPSATPITHTGTGLFVDAFCVAPLGESNCPATGGLNAEVSVFSADVVLQNNSTPKASGLAGSLLQPTVTGTARLAFQALDPNGPGIYQATAKLDGTTFYSAVPASNGGDCAVLGTDSSGAREFQSSQPCPAEVPVDIELATSTIPNGPHHLTAEIEDVAGNTAVVLDQQITIENALPNVVLSSPAPERGAANGIPASDNAILTATAREAKTYTRALSRSAITLTGRLTNSAGTPIKGAQVQLLQQPTSASTPSRLATATTSANGAWTFHVPAGPSRLLQVAYFSHLLDTKPAATLDFHESVQGVVTMHAPHRARLGHAVVFSGQLAGGYVPPGGESVQMEIFYSGRWRTIEVLPTSSKGRWTYKYVFTLGAGTSYLFRAATVPNGGYPFLGTHSKPLRVTVQR